MINRSSETLRKVTFFDFTEFFKRTPFLKQPPTFYEWFLGFAEGHGCFFLGKTKDTRKPDSEPYLRAIFSIVQEEPEILYMIKKKFGFGRVQKYGKTAFRWSVTKKEHLLLLCILAKDHMLLISRQKQLKSWCNYFALSQTIQHRRPLLLKTGWLSGFIDARGCFYDNGKKDQYTFILDQKNGKELFEYVHETFNDGYLYLRRKNTNVFRYELSVKSVHRKLLLPYLRAFPCKTRKHVKANLWYKQLVLNYKKS